MDFSKVLILPGLYNSGPDHWQTHWENKYGFTRVQQADWQTPVCTEWVDAVDAMVHADNDVILVGHSLGCCTIVHWAQRYNRKIRGALLVAPSDVDAPNYPSGTSGFQPMPMYRMPFPSIVLASTDDEYVTIDRARHFAIAWGSRFVELGNLGHINTASDLGTWPDGIKYLGELCPELFNK